MSAVLITPPTASRSRSTSIVLPSSAARTATAIKTPSSLANSLSGISTWAAQIVPGTPAAPSPRRSSFYGTPKSARSIGVFPVTPLPKPVSPSDLVHQGYTGFFIQLPTLDRESGRKQSSDALLPLPRVRLRTKSVATEGKGKIDSASSTRFRSVSFRGKSHRVNLDEMPPPLPTNAASRSSSKQNAKKIKSTPQSRYGQMLAPGNGAGALPIAQEIALAQFFDGGSFETNKKRVAHEYSRAHGTAPKRQTAKEEVYYGSKRSGEKDRRPVEKREIPNGRLGDGVSGFYQDGSGGIWRDEDEAMELAGLLPDEAPGPLRDSTVHNQEKKRRGLLPRLITSQKPVPTGAIPPPPSNWVALHSPSSPSRSRTNASNNILRKESGASISEEEDPDLDPAYAVRPRDSSAYTAAPGFVSGWSFVPERHLRRAPPGIEAFGSVDPLVENTPANGSREHTARERRERKRPLPLSLPLPPPRPAPVSACSSTTQSVTPSPQSQSHAIPIVPNLTGPSRVECEGRDEFFASSFSPSLPSNEMEGQAVRPKQARRRSITVGLSSLSALGSRVGRRASIDTASPTSPHYMRAFKTGPGSRPGTAMGNSNAHLPGMVRGDEKKLKPKASRSKLTSLFKRG